ncbi:pirin family protein [Ekhidna sp. MALMAid0563]|uniref:pirin family protein n=1 Tax=Ekhidna sp. MALMAid0563 TaxID=3143937 RepID=UPI0032DE58E5
MKKTIHRADSRGTADFGWLKSRHTFSFGQYYNPDRVHFGMLRVLNDDVVKGGAGFPTHPHDNMEIVSIPLKGALAHKDSTGTEKLINTGEVQIMSAGSGLTHSEYNGSKTDEVNFLQIWVFPKQEDIKPKYDQKVFESSDRANKIQTVVSPDDDQALWINQDAWFSLANVSERNNITYPLNKTGNGVYVFVIEGQVKVGEDTLEKRDAIGISEVDQFTVSASKDTELLFIEVPMN